MRFTESRLAKDWRANKGNPRAQLILTLFRTASFLQPRGGLWSAPRLIIGATYRVCVEWVLGIELPWKTQIGGGLRLFHGVGTVVNDETIIGNDVVLRHGVTLGHLRPGGGCPVIEDRVEFGAGAMVLGQVTIGHDSRIGPGVIVRSDILPYSVVTAPEPIVRSRRSSRMVSGEGPRT